MSDHSECPFCTFARNNPADKEGDLALSLLDQFPVCEGHTLVISRRHETDFLSLTIEEQRAMLSLSVEVANKLRANAEITGCNIGLNIGESAGQTIPHAHLHVIPRRSGDTDDPRGGVRWIFPDKAKYWD